MPDPEAHIDQIMEVVGEDVAGHSASVHVPAMLGIDFNGQLITRHVNFVGLDASTYDQVSQFGHYLLHPDNQNQVSFSLRDGGYAPGRKQFPTSGWDYRRAKTAYEKALEEERQKRNAVFGSQEKPVQGNQPSFQIAAPSELFSETTDGDVAQEFDPSVEQFPGIVLGISTCTTRFRDANNEVQDHYYCRPGDDVRMMFPNASDNAKVINQKFTVVDLYESGMSEYDSICILPTGSSKNFAA